MESQTVLQELTAYLSWGIYIFLVTAADKNS